jgi:hypothetical protein
MQEEPQQQLSVQSQMLEEAKGMGMLGNMSVGEDIVMDGEIIQ